MRLILVPTLAFSIASFPGLVKAASGHEKTKNNEMSLKAFVEKTIKEGQDRTLIEKTAKHLGFDGPMEEKFLELLPEQSSDGRGRDAIVLVEKRVDSQDLRPASVIFYVKDGVKNGAKTYWFKLNLSGVLQNAFLHEFKYDDHGIVVPGSGAWSELGVEKKDVKTALRYELDFWLKGLYHAASKSSKS